MRGGVWFSGICFGLSFGLLATAYGAESGNLQAVQPRTPVKAATAPAVKAPADGTTKPAPATTVAPPKTPRANPPTSAPKPKPSGATAAPRKRPAKSKPPAAISLDEVDRDFYYQGEYYGSIVDGGQPWKWLNLGVQVIALGEGKFEGILFYHGLPGSGWGGYKETLRGELRDEQVWLRGGTYNVMVEGRTALVHYHNGQPVGQLPKVGRHSKTLGQLPPPGAEILFNGVVDKTSPMIGEVTYDNLLIQGAKTKKSYRDFTLHVEFMLPYMPTARGQGRGNSGVYIQQRYELQILDSFGLEGKDNECGSLYKQRRPDVNACLPPLTWQTYDIDFVAARFDDKGKKTSSARITVWHNSVLIHHDVAIEDKTGAGTAEGPQPMPILLQNHGDPVRFRNIWIVDHSTPVGIPSPQLDYWPINYYAPGYDYPPGQAMPNTYYFTQKRPYWIW